ncbi:ER lumen protein retaining receptor, partial [Pseudoloma neurophilia]
LKTSLIYLIVFILRYLDLFYFQIGSLLRFYNFIMKILYILIHIYLIYMIRVKYFYSYDIMADSFNILNLLVPTAILSIFLKVSTGNFIEYFVEYCYTMSVLLEACAILPQLLLLQESGEAESMTSQYILYLGLYRLFYVFNWIIKYFTIGTIDHLLIASGLIQTLLYVDFFVIYWKYCIVRKNEKIPSTSKMASDFK